MLAALATIALAQTIPVPSYRQANDVAVITIDGVVDTVTAQSFIRRLKDAENADAVVIDLNTPGGDLMATLEICYAIKNNAPNNTVAWIHPHAFSAGTIIALACREIVAAPGSTFGDAAPINATGQPIPATERAKIESPVLAEVIDSARRNHYDEHLVESFVSVGIELWLLQNSTNGETICVNASEYETIFGEVPPRQFSPIGSTQQTASSLSPYFDSLSNITSTLATQNPTWDPSFTQKLPSSRPRLTSGDQDAWTLIKQIVPSDRLLTLKPAEAKQYGLITDVIATDSELQQWFGATSVTRHKPNWAEGLVRILISWPVRLALIAVFLICVFVEFVTGSTGVFSAGAVVSMSILIGAPYLAGLAQWWDILLVFAGIALVAVEIFVIPGTGFTGFLGVGFLFAGMVGSFISGSLQSPQGQVQLLTGLGAVVGGCILAIIGAWIIAKRLGDTVAMRRIVLEGEIKSVPIPVDCQPPLHATAVTITDLRPSGRIAIDGDVFDATTSGQWITKGATVRIIQVGLTIEVEEVT
ncbi:MAG: ATP-dependent Clp protease proteolytic subunit [Planctomycetes bacterium]|nr:ATP-dependent Clp protease proteolytic subunit [Planctomycetota bacterium]